MFDNNAVVIPIPYLLFLQHQQILVEKHTTHIIYSEKTLQPEALHCTIKVTKAAVK